MVLICKTKYPIAHELRIISGHNILKIGIYIGVLKAPETTGIGRYVIGLINSLSCLENDNQYILYYQVPIFGTPPNMPNFISDKIKMRPVKFPTKWLDERPRLWWDFVLPYVIEKDNVHIFHGPNHFIPVRGNFKKVVTIHDIAYFYTDVHGAEMDKVLREWTLKSFRAADKVIGVSQSTIDDCLREGLVPQKAIAVYQGFESRSKLPILNDADIAYEISELKLTAPAILFLGSIQPRKNVQALVKAFAKVADKIPHCLVLAGGKGSSQEKVQDLIDQFKLASRVIFTGYISDKTRAALYHYSDMFVYPSLYEGFGLVLLEAMSFGIPVITCNNSSLPEVVRDAGILVETHDIDALGNGIYKLATDIDYKNSLIDKGFKQCEIFTWEDCAKNTIHVYENTLN